MFSVYHNYLSLLQMLANIWNMNIVLEKNGVDQLDRACEKWRSIT
jgi:hypothetical protein